MKQSKWVRRRPWVAAVLSLAAWLAAVQVYAGGPPSETPCGSEAIDAGGRASIVVGSGLRPMVIELSPRRWVLGAARRQEVDLFAVADASTPDAAHVALGLALEEALGGCPLAHAPAGRRIVHAALEVLTGRPQALPKAMPPIVVAHAPARRDDAVRCEVCGTSIDRAHDEAIQNCEGHQDHPSCIRANASSYAESLAVCLENCRSAP